MRKDGIPYVQNPRNYYPPIDINKLSLEELRSKFLKTCAKSMGNLSACSKCKTPCAEGKRAMQLLANEVYSDPPVPLFAGKTLIERAKEENMLNRAKKEQEKMELHAEKEPENKPEKAPEKKRIYIKGDEWWEPAVASGDPEKYLMDTYGLTRTQAHKKVGYHARTRNESVYSEPKVEEQVNTPAKVETPPEPELNPAPDRKENDLVVKTFELKIETLMKKQADYKAKMEEYTRKYKEISEKIDVLCKAMDVIDDND